MRCRWAAIFVLTILSSCGESEAEREARALKEAVPVRLQPDGSIHLSDSDQKALGITVVRAARGSLAEKRVRFGTVVSRPEDEAILVMPLMGRVEKAPDVQVGRTVRPGDLIANVLPILGTVDQVTLSAQRSDLEGKIASATAELRTQEAEVERAKRLAQENLLSAQELLRVETVVATARAQLEGLKSSRAAYLTGAGIRLSLKSPLAGSLVFLDTAVGLTLPSGRTVARILREGPRWLDVAVLPAEESGERYETAGSQGTLAGKLLAKGAFVSDDGQRRDRIEVVGAPSANLLPGAVVPVTVFTHAIDGFVVQEDAVILTANGVNVFVQESPGIFLLRPVTIGIRSDKDVLLTAGIAEGDSVVRRGVAGLRGEALRAELRHQE